MLTFIIAQLINVYTFIIFVYVLMSWIPTKRGVLADIENALGKLCDPYLDLFRRFIPPIGGMIDISPIVAIIALQLVEVLLYWLF
ncbi:MULTISPECIES: YggT family protein [unclassified Adlercreutzia]|uniref:YggT family protein n=1 Tax=unclassified Adlercreutzia TaxID=2636013 RepID=UPI0013ED8F92|nr:MULTISPECIES: YggT family protein [unclassified Adlercreutzia]